METEVGRFRGVFEDGYSWDKDTALNLFYNFLMPNIVTSGGYVKQKLAKKGLISWATSKNEWKRRVPRFEIGTFDAINEDALNILLNTSLGDLNNNRYYQVEGEKTEPMSFDKPETSQVNRQTGEVETVKLQYGKNLSNKPSLQIETDKQDRYWQLREEIKTAKIQRDSKRRAYKNAKGELVEMYEKDLNEAIETLEALENELSETKKKAYNDDITLRQVVENDPAVEQFYSSISLSGAGLTESQQIALGIVREVSMPNEARSKAKYEEMYGDDLPYEKFKKLVETKERQYIKALGIPLLVDVKFAKLSDESIDVEVRLQDLLESGSQDGFIGPNKRFLDIISEIDYPLTIGENSYESRDSVVSLLKDMLGNPTLYNQIVGEGEANEQGLIRFVKTIINRWYKKNVEPFLNQQAEFTITETKLTEPDLDDNPVRISKKNLVNYVTDYEEERLITDSIFTIAGGADATQSKLKIELNFKNKPVSMESAYATEVGATSTDVISQVKEKTPRKGDINIDYVVNLKNNEEINKDIPLLEAQEIFKNITPILTRYGMRTKTSPDEAAKNTAKKFLTRGKFNIFVNFIEMVKDLQDAEAKDLGKSFLDENTLKRLKRFNSGLFFSGNKFKYTYQSFIDRIASKDSSLSTKINAEMENLTLLAGFLNNFIEMNTKALQSIEEDDIKEESEIEESQRAQQAREERELEQEQLAAGTEGEAGLEQAIEGEETEDYLTTERLKDNDETLQVILSILEDKDDFDKAALNMTLLKDNVQSARKAAEEKINTPYVRKSLRRFAKIVKDNLKTEGDFEEDTDQLLELVKNIQGDEVNEETRIAIKQYKEITTNYWNSILKSKENKLIDEDKLLSIIPSLKLEEGIAEDMQLDKVFNDGRLGNIKLTSKKLVLILDYKNRQAQLKGKISWESSGTSTISYKVKGGKAPKYAGALGETQSQRGLRGKRMTYTGKVQEEGFRANPIDELRYEFFQEIKRNMQVLMGVIK